MKARLPLVLVPLLALSAPALAQSVCEPRQTPDLASLNTPPTLFPHCLGDGACGAIDKTGKWHVPPKYIHVMAEEDVILAPDNSEWTQFSFFDADGTRLGGGEYSVTTEGYLPVSDGLLAVTVGEKTGFVDRTGTMVIPAEFNFAWPFEGGVAAAEKDGQFGYIDKTGKFVITLPEGYDDLGSFDGDVAVVGREGKFGLVDREGTIILEPKFDALHSDKGVLVAALGDVSGLVDREGNWIAQPEFVYVGLFSNGLAPAQKGDKFGFIDTCANWKIEPRYDYAAGFEGGPARVRNGELWGLVDKDGTEILPPSLNFVGEGLWLDGRISFSRDSEKFGLLDTSGKVALEPRFDMVEPLGGGVLMTYIGEEEKLLTLDGSEIEIEPAP